MCAGIVSVVFVRPLRRLLQLASGDWQQAVGACAAGERITRHNADGELVRQRGLLDFLRVQSNTDYKIESRLLHLVIWPYFKAVDSITNIHRNIDGP